MKYNIRGNKLAVTEPIREYIETKLGKLNKYFENQEDLAANVVISSKGINQRIEVTIPIKKTIVRAEESNQDLYTAIDKVVDKLEQQIRKNKTRIQKSKISECVGIFVDFTVSEEESALENIVKRKIIENKPMSEEEAILQMNLVGHDFYIFENTDTDCMSVVYRRKEGNYGILEIR